MRLLRVGDHRAVSARDLDCVGAHPLCELPLGIGRNHLVVFGDQIPRGQRLRGIQAKLSESTSIFATAGVGGPCCSSGADRLTLVEPEARDVDEADYVRCVGAEDAFLGHFAAEIDPVKAKVMYAVQQPLHMSTFDDVMGTPACDIDRGERRRRARVATAPAV
jgi:hypothetical protein